MRFESFYASFSPSLHPVTDRSFAYSQCHSYVLLWPALLFQLPGLFPSFFSPIGFLWCSHTSYGITLYFLLPLSVSPRTCTMLRYTRYGKPLFVRASTSTTPRWTSACSRMKRTRHCQPRSVNKCWCSSIRIG